MLLLAEVRHGEVVYDLGCGDGPHNHHRGPRVRSPRVGVELKEDLVRMARRRVSELGLDGRVRIVHGDLFEVDVSPADVVTLYLTTSANRKVKPKLERELKSGARVVSHNYQIPGWTPEKTESIHIDPEFYLSRRKIYLYKNSDQKLSRGNNLRLV